MNLRRRILVLREGKLAGQLPHATPPPFVAASRKSAAISRVANTYPLFRLGFEIPSFSLDHRRAAAIYMGGRVPRVPAILTAADTTPLLPSWGDDTVDAGLQRDSRTATGDLRENLGDVQVQLDYLPENNFDPTQRNARWRQLQTARAQIVKIREGVMSLRRAFRIAGAETVLASHWSVSDKATSQLMTEFMRRWQAGEPRAKAWREAQLSLLRSKDFASPYFWAAFTLTGQWR